MNKEDIGILARYMTDMKDSLKELEAAVKKKDSTRINSAKRKIIELQVQINRRL